MAFTGCTEMQRDGPVCVFWERSQAGPRGRWVQLPGEMRLWVQPPAGTRRLWLHTEGEGSRPLAVADHLVSLQVPPAARRIEVRALIPEGMAVWSLRCARYRLPSWWIPAPSDATPEETSAWMRTLEEQLPRAPRELAGPILRRLAGSAKDERQEFLYRRSMMAYAAAGQPLGEVLRGTAVASAVISRHRFQEAQQLLDTLAADQPQPAFTDARALVAIAYTRGVLARQDGDLRTALRELHGAADLAGRLRLDPRWPGAIWGENWPDATGQEEALVLQDLGRGTDANAIFQRLEKRAVAVVRYLEAHLMGPVPCNQQEQLPSNQGWTLLMQQEASGNRVEPGDSAPLHLLEGARDIIARGGCSDQARIDVPISLALAEWQAGDAAGARRSLAEADRIAVTVQAAARRPPSSLPASPPPPGALSASSARARPLASSPPMAPRAPITPSEPSPLSSPPSPRPRPIPPPPSPSSPAPPAAGSPSGCGLDRAAAAMTPEQQLWRYELEARLAIAAGAAGRALQLYGCLERLAEGRLSPPGLWLAAYGKARAYEKLGNVPQALASYRQAEALIDQQSFDVPIFDGSRTFLALRERGTRDFLGLLVGLGRADQAFAEVRRARSRLLRQLDRSERLVALPPAQRAQWQQSIFAYQQRRAEVEEKAADDWRLAADELARVRAARDQAQRDLRQSLDAAFAVLGRGSGELAPLLPGECVLAYYDLGAGHGVGFAARAVPGAGGHPAEGAAPSRGAPAAAVRMAVLDWPLHPELHPARLAPRLLGPFGDEIRQAHRVRVLSSGALKEVNFHALPFDGDILLTKRPVVYGLDLPVRVVPPGAVPGAAPAAGGRGAPGGVAPPRPGGPLRAVILGDPRGDLPAARDEARAVEQVLAADGGWRIKVLPEDASAATLSGRLDGCDLFHYAGHARSAADWNSMLLLARGAALTLPDLLALRRAPSWVVLSGCDTGKQEAGAAFEVPSLAHAFLLAGARGVVAAVRQVDDATARDLSVALYQSWQGGPDLAAGLRKAQLALYRAQTVGWESFRLFEP